MLQLARLTANAGMLCTECLLLRSCFGLGSEWSSSCCSRYDYEGVESEKAEKMVAHVRDVIAKANKGDSFGEFKLEKADDFEYKVCFLLWGKARIALPDLPLWSGPVLRRFVCILEVEIRHVQHSGC